MRRYSWTAAMLAGLCVFGCGGRGEKDVKKAPPADARLRGSSSGPKLSSASRTYKELSMYAPETDAVGPAGTDVADSGRVLFDGARPASAAGLFAGFGPGAGAAPAAARSGARKTVPLASPAPLPRRRPAEPPLPEDPAALAGFARGAGASARGAGQGLLGFALYQSEGGFDKVYPILSRMGWGARKSKGAETPMRPYRVTVHHTDGSRPDTEEGTAAEVRSIQGYHQYGRAREGKDTWNDIGYHFLIDGAGRVAEGRHVDALGAHAGGANDGNIGIAMLGDYNKLKPTPDQIESLTRLVAYLAMKYKRDPMEKGFLEPHQHYGQTDCPGKNMMAILDQLRRGADRVTQGAYARSKTSAGTFVPVAAVAAPAAPST